MMTERETAEWIVRYKDCDPFFALGSIPYISCTGEQFGSLNHGTKCPLACGKFHCGFYKTKALAAQAWLEAHKEEV